MEKRRDYFGGYNHEPAEMIRQCLSSGISTISFSVPCNISFSLISNFQDVLHGPVLVTFVNSEMQEVKKLEKLKMLILKYLSQVNVICYYKRL